MYQRPAIAVASSKTAEFMAQYAHTDRDTVELADARLIATAALFLAEVVRTLSE